MKNKSYTRILTDNALQYNLDNALQYLKEELVMRDSGNELCELIHKKDADLKIMKAQFGTVNISNWLKGKPISREKAIELCFFLKLETDEAEQFLQRTCGHDWFHLRSYEDFIYFFCMSNELSYEKACELKKEYEYLDVFNPSVIKKGDSAHSTHLISHEAADLLSEKDLRDYIEKNQAIFGKYNNTAYDYFKEFFDSVWVKRNNMTNVTENDKYNRVQVSFEEICDEMRMGIPYGLSKSKLTPLQRAIFDDAPDRQTLTIVYKREPDKKSGKIPQVKRKSLIIAWMLANDYEGFEGNVKLINEILYDCGMPMLDSKNPFDWIVLNALNSKGVERMEEIIQEVFNLDPEDING